MAGHEVVEFAPVWDLHWRSCAKLIKCDRPLGKRFFGYQKFSDFLVSIPHVQLQYLGEGNFWVCLVPLTISAIKNKQKDRTSTQKLHNEGKNMDGSADGVPRISSSYVSSEGDDSKSFQSMPSTFFSWISSRWTFWKHNAKPDDLPTYHLGAWEDPRSLEEWQHDASVWENMSVSVWWDFDSCGVPSDISFLNVAPSIMGVLRANRIKGPIHIDAYGNVSQLSEIKQEALYLSGIDLHHIPGGKNISHKRLVDWASKNRPPAHLFLISDNKDKDFFRTLGLLDDRYYNILRARPKTSPFTKDCYATIVWQWSSILKEKYLTGKYCNVPPHWFIKGQVPLEYPPEWYRNSKVPLENPFSATEEPTSSQNAEIHKPSLYINLVEVPNSLSRQVRKILSSYPNGISIEDLRLQLRLIYTSLHKTFYGHNEFCNILVSIPHVQLL